jgi:hypothetical protein
MIDAPTPLFDTAPMIGEGMQARLDIAIDTDARRPKWTYTPKPEQMPGQTSMEGTP